MVTVVDAANFERDFDSADSLKDRGQEVDTNDVRSIVDLLMDQIEFADVILLNKIDTINEATKASVIASIKAINSKAELIETIHGKIDPKTILNTRRFDIDSAEQMPDWLKIIEKEPIPETEEYGINHFVYRARRPFHPERWNEWMKQKWPGVIRSKGFFWLATRMSHVGVWSKAGTQNKFEMAGKWFASVDRKRLAR